MTQQRSMLAPANAFGVYSDAARRIAERYNLHAIVPGNERHWCAFRLSDGGTDDIPYDSWCTAVSSQLHWTQCVYVKLPHVAGATMTDQDAEALLTYWRNVYDHGGRPPHPPEPCNGRCGW